MTGPEEALYSFVVTWGYSVLRAGIHEAPLASRTPGERVAAPGIEPGEASLMRATPGPPVPPSANGRTPRRLPPAGRRRVQAQRLLPNAENQLLHQGALAPLISPETPRVRWRGARPYGKPSMCTSKPSAHATKWMILRRIAFTLSEHVDDCVSLRVIAAKGILRAEMARRGMERRVRELERAAVRQEE